ncbi:hypothetical protein U1Q18_011180 [Sarracenia purpurea var. burkii]
MNKCLLFCFAIVNQIYEIDAASGAAVSALNISLGDHVLDLCASPGKFTSEFSLDLQVKSSPAAQNSLPINNDPAIIQSHYPRPPSTSTSLPSIVTGSLTDLGSHSTQLGHPVSSFQGSLPLYQPGGNLGSCG